ncbi:MAG: hypothetical protein J5365_08420 [Erysipelotrichaceae bacterium]|nr:hypothetical protein [Erysipelotrichaceae bacterium]
MQKLRDINEALAYLKEGEIITENGMNRFVMRGERVSCYDSGTRFSLELNEFRELYQKNSFYLYEETVQIDEDKDEAYYRYYKK